MKKTIIFLAALFTCAAATAKTDNTETVEPFDRGIGVSTTTFIPKGTVGAGVAFSYNNYNVGQGIDDAGYSVLFSLLGDIHGNMQSWGVAPWVSYFVADNFAVGVRFDYSKSALGLGNASIALGDLLNFSLNDFHFLKQSYTGAITGRYYIPFANSKRFAMFTEVRAIGGYGQSETYKVEESQKYGTYQDIYKFELGLVPGLSVFVTNEVAVEVSVGLLGFNYNKTVQTTNQIETSMMESSGANFKINPLSVGLGLSFYIPTGVNRAK
jgi:hypothetical protein